MNYDQQELTDYLHLFEWEHHCPEWEQYRSPENTRLLCERVVSLGGLLSVSHFIISFRQLCESGAIKQVRALKPIDSEDPGELTAEQYKSLPSAVVQRRFKIDSDFRSQVENLIAQGKI